jgi:prolipoprotein diacylglyceryltransferase
MSPYAWMSSGPIEIDPEHRPERYADQPTFHPVFLYEIIWNLALAALLVRFGRRLRPPGVFALYVAGYSAFRIFAELIRVDPAKHFLGLRLNLFVAVALCALGLLWFWRTQRHSDAGGSDSGSPGSGASSGSSSAGGPSG